MQAVKYVARLAAVPVALTLSRGHPNGRAACAALVGGGNDEEEVTFADLEECAKERDVLRDVVVNLSVSSQAPIGSLPPRDSLPAGSLPDR